MHRAADHTPRAMEPVCASFAPHARVFWCSTEPTSEKPSAIGARNHPISEVSSTELACPRYSFEGVDDERATGIGDLSIAAHAMSEILAGLGSDGNDS